MVVQSVRNILDGLWERLRRWVVRVRKSLMVVRTQVPEVRTKRLVVHMKRMELHMMIWVMDPMMMRN